MTVRNKKFDEHDEKKQRFIALMLLNLLRLQRYRNEVAGNGNVPQEIRNRAPFSGQIDYLIEYSCKLALPGMWNNEKKHEIYIKELEEYLEEPAFGV